MKKLIAVAAILSLGLTALVGCEASARVGDDSNDHVSYHKTTVDRPDGSTVHEETRVEKNY
jgi:hypothetical protein